MPRNQYLQLFIESNNQIHRPKQRDESGLCSAQSQEHEAGQTDGGHCQRGCAGTGAVPGPSAVPPAPQHSPGEISPLLTELWSMGRISFGQKWGIWVSPASCSLQCSGCTYPEHLRLEFVLLTLQCWLDWACPNY